MKKKTKKIIETSFPESDNIKTEILNARTGQNVQKIIELVKKDINISQDKKATIISNNSTMDFQNYLFL